MSETESVVIGVAVLIPVMLIGRRLVQVRSRQPFTRDELVTYLASIAIGVFAVLVFQSRSLLTWIPPTVLLLSGLYLVASQREHAEQRRLTQISGVLAVVVGTAGLLVLVLRFLVGP